MTDASDHLQPAGLSPAEVDIPGPRTSKPDSLFFVEEAEGTITMSPAGLCFPRHLVAATGDTIPTHLAFPGGEWIRVLRVDLAGSTGLREARLGAGLMARSYIAYSRIP